jgi:recombination protein RecT
MAQDLAQMKEGGKVAQQPKDFPSMLKAFLPEIQRALPKHMTGDRMARIALTEFRKNPQLAECDPRSVFAAIIVGSQLGLEPGVMGQAYLVPYKGVCQLIPGWQGYVDLVSRSGRASVWTGAVYEGDQFEWGMGDKQYINHRPGPKYGMGKLTHVYAVGRIKDSEWPVIEVWSVERVTHHRDQYNKVGKRHYSFENFEMYARKVPLLQVIKYMPKSVEIQRALELDLAGTVGAQSMSIQDAVEGSWSYVPDDQQDLQQPAVEQQQSREVPQQQARQQEYQPGGDDLDDPFNEKQQARGFE